MKVESAFARLLVWQSDAPREVNDFEARKDLGLQDADFSAIESAMPGVLLASSLTEIDCPGCGATIPLPPETSSAYCTSCRQIWTTGQFPAKTYSLDREACTDLLTKRALGELSAGNFAVEMLEEPRGLLAFAGDIPVGIRILPREARLKDFFALRGSLKDPAGSVAILAAPSFEDVLQFYTRNSPESGLLNTLDWLENGVEWTTVLSERSLFIQGSRRVERAVGETFAELKIADDIGREMTTLLRLLPLLSLQISDGSTSSIGNKFQQCAITVLNAFTPFKILPIGGKNQEDGVMRFYSVGVKKMPKWYPVGIKSFESKAPDKDRCYPLKDAMLQLRKYARAYTQEESVAREVVVPSYILIAHDFDMADSTVESEVKAFRDDTGLPLKLLPVKTILDLVKGFVDLHPELVPDEVLERHLQDGGTYLDPTWVTRLMTELRDYQKTERTDLKIRRVRKRLEQGHA